MDLFDLVSWKIQKSALNTSLCERDLDFFRVDDELTLRSIPLLDLIARASYSHFSSRNHLQTELRRLVCTYAVMFCPVVDLDARVGNNARYHTLQALNSVNRYDGGNPSIT